MLKFTTRMPPRRRAWTYYEAAATSESTDRVPFESNTSIDSNPPPQQQRSTTTVATLSVARRAIMHTADSRSAKDNAHR